MTPDDEKKQIQENAAEARPEKSKDQDPPGPEWEAELDSYPLREKSEDKPWAVRTVWTWMGILTVCLIFIMTMLILGTLYD